MRSGPKAHLSSSLGYNQEQSNLEFMHYHTVPFPLN